MTAVGRLSVGMLLAFCVGTFAGGCAAHATRVRCDGRLQAINAPAPVVKGDPVARTPTAKDTK